MSTEKHPRTRVVRESGYANTIPPFLGSLHENNRGPLFIATEWPTDCPYQPEDIPEIGAMVTMCGSTYELMDRRPVQNGSGKWFLLVLRPGLYMTGILATDFLSAYRARQEPKGPCPKTVWLTKHCLQFGTYHWPTGCRLTVGHDGPCQPERRIGKDRRIHTERTGRRCTPGPYPLAFCGRGGNDARQSQRRSGSDRRGS